VSLRRVLFVGFLFVQFAGVFFANLPGPHSQRLNDVRDMGFVLLQPAADTVSYLDAHFGVIPRVTGFDETTVLSVLALPLNVAMWGLSWAVVSRVTAHYAGRHRRRALRQ
jgi:hypothetical protein